jgi:hypothetical protein
MLEEIGRLPHVRMTVHPDFPVKFPGVDELHAAFPDESRTRILWWCLVQEIRDHGSEKTGEAQQSLLPSGANTLENRHRPRHKLGRQQLKI